jgi:membrane protein implicated in regulation of membrane protease activity
LRRHPLESEQPLLNERAAQLIGQTFDLVDPIVNGRGSIHAGDTICRVEGPELPAGTRIKAVGTNGSVPKVEPADGAPAA